MHFYCVLDFRAVDCTNLPKSHTPVFVFREGNFTILYFIVLNKEY